MISEHVRILAVTVPQLAFREEQRQILLTNVIEVSTYAVCEQRPEGFDIVPYGTILRTHSLVAQDS
jgi:hypothetical protein